MDPIELIKLDLGAKWNDACRVSREPVQELPAQCPFARHRLFIVYGKTDQFDFPCLPHGSCGYYVADDRCVTRLTRNSKEIELILANEWSCLTMADPVRLASLVLKFYDLGIGASHEVIKDAETLRAFGDRTYFGGKYTLNEKEFLAALPKIGSTTLNLEDGLVHVRAVTLCGWMHAKQNLGIESLTIAADGHVSLAKRQVLSKRIFSQVPSLRY